MLASARQFPDFLAPAFDAAQLERQDTTIAALDRETRIVWVNRAWEAFSRANGGSFSLEGDPTYLGGITGPLRAYYAEVFDRALRTGEVFEEDYDCSTPRRARQYRLRVLPIQSRGFLVEHTPVDEVAAGELADPGHYQDSNGIILQCSHCRRVRSPHSADSESWVWVPGWFRRTHPRISHGICPSCVGFYWRRRRV